MRSDWVAASVRARAMARRRAGAGRSRELAAAPGLQAALDRLSDTVYREELHTARTLAQAQRATRRTVLWQLRVLAGWVPAGGTRLVRAAAAAFEADNILALDRTLRRGQPATTDAMQTASLQADSLQADSEPNPAAVHGADGDFDLGALATAWPRLKTAGNPEQLRGGLASSPWGDPGTDAAPADILTMVWLRRLASEAAAARPWAAAAGVLICARLLLVDRTGPSDRLVTLLRPLLGTDWTQSDSVESLRAALPPAAAPALDGVDTPSELWRAEAAFAARVETDGFGLLRSGLPGPDVVLGAMAVLAADAWRVRAALAGAAVSGAVDTGGSEVLNAVA